MQVKGLSTKEVLAELRVRQAKNMRYNGGRILCSMCTAPHPIAKKAYDMYFESNLGDRGLFPAASLLEAEVISQLGELLNCKSAAGFIVSGGTEANLLALTAARNTAKKPDPEVILSQSAHFSLTKVCNLLGIKVVYAPLDAAFRVNPQEVEKLVNVNTVAIVGTAGTAELGAVDPIAALSTIALKHDVHLHVDAAFGGLVIPFLKDKPYPFDFALDGVKSVTVDPHKMGMAAVPAGGILFRYSDTLQSLKTETPYLTEKYQYTFVGTRTGASAASAWAVFRALGREGFQNTVQACMNNTGFLVRGIQNAGLNLVCEPMLNIVAFQAPNTKNLAANLHKRGWMISYIPRYDCIRIVVMPHVKRRHIVDFLEDLEKLKDAT